jgi:anti-sigma B factor antagonist
MANENMQIVASPGAHDGQKVLQLKGPLNIHTIFDFQNAVRSDSSPVLIIDFSGVPFIDSAGLGALVGAHIASQKANRKLALVAMNTQVKALLEMTQVGKFFRTFPTLQEAQSAVS